MNNTMYKYNKRSIQFNVFDDDGTVEACCPGCTDVCTHVPFNKFIRATVPSYDWFMCTTRILHLREEDEIGELYFLGLNVEHTEGCEVLFQHRAMTANDFFPPLKNDEAKIIANNRAIYEKPIEYQKAKLKYNISLLRVIDEKNAFIRRQAPEGIIEENVTVYKVGLPKIVACKTICGLGFSYRAIRSNLPLHKFIRGKNPSYIDFFCDTRIVTLDKDPTGELYYLGLNVEAIQGCEVICRESLDIPYASPIINTNLEYDVSLIKVVDEQNALIVRWLNPNEYLEERP